MPKFKALSIAILAGAIMPWSGGASSSAGSGAADVLPRTARKSAPDFTLEDVRAKQITLSKYRGKVVLLDFWAMNCGGCKIELPWYVEFQKKYKAKGLELIGLDMYGESPDLIRPFTEKWHMEYPVAVGTDAIGDRFGLKEMPLTVLIDRDGKVAVSHSGVVDKNKFEGDIQQLLEEHISGL